MKIKQIEIKNFGNIYNKTLIFSPGVNVLYGENEYSRKEIHSFIEHMLLGIEDMPYYGILWFESKGRNYRLTRNLYGENPYNELLCEESGELIDADRLSESRTVMGISGAVYENAVCITPLKGSTGAEIVREVQKQMKGFQETADCSEDLGRTYQRIKMTRKGYQAQVDRRRKSDELEKEKISSQMRQLRGELRDLEEQKTQLGTQESELRQSEESNGYQMLDQKIAELEKKNRMQTVGMCATLLAAFALAAFLGICLQSILLTILAAVAGGVLFAVQLNYEMRTVRELEKRKRMRLRWITRHDKLEGGRSSLEEEICEKKMELSNLTDSLRELEEYAYFPLVEELETDALNLAMQTIETLSERIYRKTGNRLVSTMSEILREITGGDCREFLVDEELHISVETADGVIPIEKMRLFTVEQIYLALRLAAGDLLCGAERLPVLFNEMFSTFDPERLRTAVSWLIETERQVIISTGKKKELDMIEKTGLTCNVMIV